MSKTHSVVINNAGFPVNLTATQSAVYQMLLSRSSLMPFQMSHLDLGKLTSLSHSATYLATKYLRESRLISCHLGKYDRRNIFTFVQD